MMEETLKSKRLQQAKRNEVGRPEVPHGSPVLPSRKLTTHDLE